MASPFSNASSPGCAGSLAPAAAHGHVSTGGHTDMTPHQFQSAYQHQSRLHRPLTAVTLSLGMGVGVEVCVAVSQNPRSQFGASPELVGTPVNKPSWGNLKCLFGVNTELISGAWRRPPLQRKHVLDCFLTTVSTVLYCVTHLGFTNACCSLLQAREMQPLSWRDTGAQHADPRPTSISGQEQVCEMRLCPDRSKLFQSG